MNNPSNKINNILVGTFLPPLLGALLSIIVIKIQNMGGSWGIEYIGYAIIFSYMGVGIQSFIYSLFMSLLVIPNTNKTSLILSASIMLSCISIAILPFVNSIFKILKEELKLEFSEL